MNRGREWRALEREIRARGYVIVNGKRHPKVKTPEGVTVATLCVSASDHRSLLNARAQLRRLGVLPKRA